MNSLINPRYPNGVYKTIQEKDKELQQLLQTYRRQNLLLHDKIYNLETNLIPQKDELILTLKEQLKQINDKLINDTKEKSKTGWFY
tara:strand:- start:149 stop:406 length:258 start_codon:yes stop_codon:yes gene_type:complete